MKPFRPRSLVNVLEDTYLPHVQIIGTAEDDNFSYATVVIGSCCIVHYCLVKKENKIYEKQETFPGQNHTNNLTYTWKDSGIPYQEEGEV